MCCICIVLIVCSVSFIVFIVLCAVFCLVVVLFCVMCVICVLCLIVVPLPPGKNPFAVKINNNNIIIIINFKFLNQLSLTKHTSNFKMHCEVQVCRQDLQEEKEGGIVARYRFRIRKQRRSCQWQFSI
jgi:hypothetical protein